MTDSDSIDADIYRVFVSISNRHTLYVARYIKEMRKERERRMPIWAPEASY